MQTGIDKLEKNPNLIKNFGRIGLVVNQASTTSTFIPTVDVVWNATKKTTGAKLTAMFGPQHGYGQTEQDNMRETDDSYFHLSSDEKIPLFSLYSKTREPLREHLEHVDTLIVDLRDIGCRSYTYMLTLAGCLRMAAKFGKKVVVLDRPNPLGLAKKINNEWRRVEGNCLDTRWHSFVGWYSIPMRHGLTMGELGKLFIKVDKLHVDYKVITVKDLTRSTSFNTLKSMSWVMPSPNIPSWLNSFFFPAFVSLEGTNVSEGRGTTIPFELIGAPWLNVPNCIKFLTMHQNLYLTPARANASKKDLLNQSISFRQHNFRPTFNKHVGNVCNGLHFGLLKPENINIFALGMCFLAYCSLYHRGEFQWSTQQYEYNFSDLPINLILGTDAWEKMFSSLDKNCDSLKAMLRLTQSDANSFAQKNQDIFIYK